MSRKQRKPNNLNSYQIKWEKLSFLYKLASFRFYIKKLISQEYNVHDAKYAYRSN